MLSEVRERRGSEAELRGEGKSHLPSPNFEERKITFSACI